MSGNRSIGDAFSFLRKVFPKKQANVQSSRVCEHCQKNPARVRVDRLHAGQRESQYLCESCVNELRSSLS